MATRYSFDGWAVDIESGELRRGAACVRIQDHPLQVLQALLEAPGEVVTRQSLISRLWPHGVVDFEMGLNTAVRRLRVALGDDAEAPKYIETVPRRGYRFIFPVAQPGAGSDEAQVSRAHARFPVSRVLLVAVAAAFAATAVVVWYAATRGSMRIDTDPSIAVLPFVELGASDTRADVATGAAEDIAATLGKIPGLRVIGRTSALYFKGRTDDLRTIGKQLGATYLVEGSVRESGHRIRLTADLVETRTGVRLWSDAYEREYADLLDTQLQIATAIARSLQLAVDTDIRRGLRNAHNMEAYSLYLRGRAAIDRGDANVFEANADFEQALASDPLFLQAAEALALAYLDEIGGKLTAPAVGWPGAVRAARRALQMDAGSMFSHAILGLEDATYEYDWPAAAHELDVIQAAKPRDPDVLYMAAWLAFDLGRHDEAVHLQDAALALDPMNPDSLQNSGYIHFLMRDYPRAEADFRRSIAVSPTFLGNHRMLGRTLLQLGHPQAALEQMLAEPPPTTDLGLAFAYHALGRQAESNRALARTLKSPSSCGPVNIALAYAYRGDKDQAFDWLRRAVAEHDLNLGHDLKYDPALDELRNDPRYHAVLRAVRLEE